MVILGETIKDAIFGGYWPIGSYFVLINFFYCHNWKKKKKKRKKPKKKNTFALVF